MHKNYYLGGGILESEKITVISSKKCLFNLNLKELWNSRELAWLFVKRDLKNTYKQTILGPLWILINPLLSTVVFTVIFGVIAHVSTDGIPRFLFYMIGNIMWGFFSNCLNRSSSTFISNARIFGKVYFPRLIMPISGVIYYLINFGIQFLVFIGLVAFYFFKGSGLQPNFTVLLIPVFILQLALLGTAVGIIISSLTTKYRDLNVLVSFGVTLWMYITPVVYPISAVPQSLRWLMLANPVAPIIEAARYSFFGTGTFSVKGLLLSAAVTVVLLFIGIIVFNRVERNFIDTV